MTELTIAVSLAWWWQFYWRAAVWSAMAWVSIGFPLDQNAFAAHIGRMARRAVRIKF